MKFKENEHLEFLVMERIVKGNFISKDKNLITIKITYTEFSWEKIGDAAKINKSYLKNKK